MLSPARAQGDPAAGPRGGATHEAHEPAGPGPAAAAVPTRMISSVRQDRKTPPAPEAARECPACGGPMVLREARKGPRAGKKFWGCSSYPECRGAVAQEDG